MLLESRDSARTRARNEQNRGLNRQHARLDIPRTGQTPIQTIAAPIVCIGHCTPKPVTVRFDRAGNTGQRTDIAVRSIRTWIPVKTGSSSENADTGARLASANTPSANFRRYLENRIKATRCLIRLRRILDTREIHKF